MSARRNSPPDVGLFVNGSIPGVIGIRNHGYTCFASAVVQCLSNTERFSEHFITDGHRSQLVVAKTLNRSCTITKNLARLIESLWSCEYVPELSEKFLSSVGKSNEQFTGNRENDAHEFLLWLLNTVVDELCGPAGSPTTNNNSAPLGRDAANECNTGIVSRLFMSEFRSVLTCPTCRKESRSLEKFLCIPLPLPGENQKPISVTIVKFQPHTKRTVVVKDSQTIADLKSSVAEVADVPKSKLLLVQLSTFYGFERTFSDDDRLPEAKIRNSSQLVALQLHSESVETVDKSVAGERIFVVALNIKETAQPMAATVFGDPFVVQVFRDATYSGLVSCLLYAMEARLKPGALQSLHERLQSTFEAAFRIKVFSCNTEGFYLSDDPNLFPLYLPHVEQALDCCHVEEGPRHIKITLEWSSLLFYRWFPESDKTPSPVETSRHEVREAVVTLDDCFSSFTASEKLDTDGIWFCPNCRANKSGTMKALYLSSLPEVLIIHLKRFKQVGRERVKIDTHVEFPVSDLNMLKYVEREKDREETGADAEKYLYDLYAVCNHYGSLHTGHYTAYCRNPITGDWYEFNDDKVTELHDVGAVVTKSAYLLFYRCRAAAPSSPNETALAQWIQAICDAAYDNNVGCDKPGHRIDRTSDAASPTLDASRLTTTEKRSFMGNHVTNSNIKIASPRTLSGLRDGRPLLPLNDTLPISDRSNVTTTASKSAVRSHLTDSNMTSTLLPRASTQSSQERDNGLGLSITGTALSQRQSRGSSVATATEYTESHRPANRPVESTVRSRDHGRYRDKREESALCPHCNCVHVGDYSSPQSSANSRDRPCHCCPRHTSRNATGLSNQLSDLNLSNCSTKTTPARPIPPRSQPSMQHSSRYVSPPWNDSPSPFSFYRSIPSHGFGATSGNSAMYNHQPYRNSERPRSSGRLEYIARRYDQ